MVQKRLKSLIFCTQTAFKSCFFVFIYVTPGTTSYKTLKFDIFSGFRNILINNRPILAEHRSSYFKTPKPDISRFSKLVFPGSSYNLDIWTNCSSKWGKKTQHEIFRFFVNFQNGGHFCRKKKEKSPYLT